MSAQATLVPLLATAWLPPVQWWAHALAAGQVWIEQHEHYLKRTWRNRTHLAGPNGRIALSLPLKKGKNEQMPIRQVRLAADAAWARRVWKTIHSAYGRAPWFAHFADEVVQLLPPKEPYLFDYNLRWINVLKQMLQVSFDIHLTTQWMAPPVTGFRDLRYAMGPKVPLSADAHFVPKPYPQLFQERYGFLPNLSVLDLLFCAGPEAGRILRASIHPNGVQHLP